MTTYRIESQYYVSISHTIVADDEDAALEVAGECDCQVEGRIGCGQQLVAHNQASDTHIIISTDGGPQDFFIEEVE